MLAQNRNKHSKGPRLIAWLPWRIE